MSEFKNIRASDLMIGFSQVPPNATVSECLDVFFPPDSIYMPHTLLVIDDKKLVGICTPHDFLRKVPWSEKSAYDILASEIMTKEVAFVRPDESLKNVVGIIRSRDVRYLPVVGNNNVEGLIGRRAIVNLFIEHTYSKFHVTDLMTSVYATLSAYDSIGDFLKKYLLYRDKYMVVLSGRNVVGVMTPWDFLRAIHASGGYKPELTIGDIMTKQPFFAKPDEKCDKVILEMVKLRIGSVPVVGIYFEGILRKKSIMNVIEI